MESPENIAGGYSQSGGWGGSGSDPNNNDRGGDNRTVDELRAAQEINLLNTNAYLNDINLSNPRGIDQVMNLFTSQYGPISRSAFNTAYDRTLANPGGINTLGYNTAKTLNRIAPSLFSGQVKSNVPQLTGTVFGKKNKAGETLISSGGKSMGMSAEDYYSGLSGADLNVIDAETLGVGRPDLETYQDKYGYATPQERALQRAYDQYMNPYNDPSLPGYNRDVKNIGAGEVRPGLQSGIFTDMSGTPTQLGPVATYDRNYSGTDNLAMLGFGTMGTLARALTNKVTGIEGQPLPAAALAPTPEMIAQGQTSGGMARSFSQIPGQAKQGIESLIAPNVPAPNPVQTAPLDLDKFEQRFGSTNSLSGEQLAGGSWFETDEDKAMRERQRQQFRESQEKSPNDIRSEGFENIMDLIEQNTASVELGGPATANQLAQVDYSNLTDVGGNLYQPSRDTGMLDSILESFGIKASPSRPSGQIYSGAKKPQSLFDYIGFGQ